MDAMRVSTTKRQHFISQIEQRLNAVNPEAKPENQRIYQFDVVDRKRHVVSISDAKGRVISNTLTMFDLFSFDVHEGGVVRANFEDAFSRYESTRCRSFQAVSRL